MDDKLASGEWNGEDLKNSFQSIQNNPMMPNPESLGSIIQGLGLQPTQSPDNDHKGNIIMQDIMGIPTQSKKKRRRKKKK